MPHAAQASCTAATYVLPLYCKLYYNPYRKLYRQVYEAYCDRSYLISTGEHRMSVSGFLRLLHDCLLLDNATTPAIADAIFTGVPLGATEAIKVSLQLN